MEEQGLQLCAKAAEYRSDVLKWLRDIGNCKWNHTIPFRAVSNGHIDVLVYAIEQGCCIVPLFLQVCAIMNGDENLLSWMHLHGIRCQKEDERRILLKYVK